MISDNMTLDRHISTACHSAYIEIRHISCIHLLSGCPLHPPSWLPKVQNSAAKLVFKVWKHDHVQPPLQALHWLLVQTRTDYKLSTICHNFFSDSSPAYFSDLLTVYTPFRQLRSSADTWILHIPHVRTKTFDQHRFSYCALTLI